MLPVMMLKLLRSRHAFTLRSRLHHVLGIPSSGFVSLEGPLTSKPVVDEGVAEGRALDLMSAILDDMLSCSWTATRLSLRAFARAACDEAWFDRFGAPLEIANVGRHLGLTLFREYPCSVSI